MRGGRTHRHGHRGVVGAPVLHVHIAKALKAQTRPASPSEHACRSNNRKYGPSRLQWTKRVSEQDPDAWNVLPPASRTAPRVSDSVTWSRSDVCSHLYCTALLARPMWGRTAVVKAAARAACAQTNARHTRPAVCCLPSCQSLCHCMAGIYSARGLFGAAGQNP